MAPRIWQPTKAPARRLSRRCRAGAGSEGSGTMEVAAAPCPGAAAGDAQTPGRTSVASAPAAQQPTPSSAGCLILFF